ncbi:hypothetical protein Micbo1qcDRAFT_179839 [Microdochium bolleyi]|uniref:Glycosyltransferase family 25 protein n=1 Tax=Microdochium bolleyi TaxID=196109 RepID=A0A136INS9_9PEZI|nr:hypothetical protein Micbo1qcDRAFT_179839 [Microdochium bolleyi]
MANRLQRKSHIYLGIIGMGMIITSIVLLFPRESRISRFMYSEGEALLGAARRPTDLATPREQVANATLGTSQDNSMLAGGLEASWLQRSRQVSTSPSRHPPVSQVMIETFQHMGPPGKATRPEQGSAAAWLAHIDILRHVVSSDLESALIVEDDVDWDLRIKHQMQLISDNIREFTRAGDDPADTTPYGSASTGWDVLWIGHCGSMSDNLDGTDPSLRKPIFYRDSTRPTNAQYRGWARDFVVNEVPDGHRAVFESRMTICTFAYAVSRRGAYNLLDLATRANSEAFDVALHEYCRDKKLKRIMVSPQVFNHYEPSADRGHVSLVKGADGKGEAKDESEFEDYKGSTENIVNSARCMALWGKSCMAT